MIHLYLTVGLELSICIQKAFTVGHLTENTLGRACHNEDGAVETECDCQGPVIVLIAVKGLF
jgi:hypothetical protein